MKSSLVPACVLALSSLLPAQASIPVGTILPVSLNSTLDTKKSKPGQIITANIAQEVPLYDGRKIKAGTRVSGEIVSVTAGASQPARIVLRFDKIDFSGKQTSMATNLRALASPLDVEAAQEPKSGFDRGVGPKWNWTTEQIGGDVVYGGYNPVYSGLKPVGTPVNGGILARVVASPGEPCRGAVAGNDNPQALWVFSHDACGVYGYEAVIDRTGAENTHGNIAIASTQGDLKLRSGSGMLLRVIGAGGEAESTKSITK
jgi:hypothetical protein